MWLKAIQRDKTFTLLLVSEKVYILFSYMSKIIMIIGIF